MQAYNTQDYDVLVAGGGSAGVAAAVAAARAGARTLLVERGPCLGGAATLRNVVTYCGLYARDSEQQVVFGVAQEVLARLRAKDAVSEPTRFTSVSVVFDPEQVKVVLDALCADAGVHVLLHSMIVAAESAGDLVRSVTVADHSGLRRVSATAFVDATGEADLAARAGAVVRYGNGGLVQNGTLGVRLGGIPHHAAVSRSAVRDAIRAIGTDDATGTEQDTGLIARMPVSGDLITYLVDEGYDARSAADTSRAEARARRRAQACLAAIRALPGCAEAYIVTTGPELGTRESRHVAAVARLTEADLIAPRPSGQAIAVGAWPMEYHPGPGLPVRWAFIGPPGYYDIPLDCLRSTDRANLFAAGRAVDGDKGAGASLRVMGTAFATGQAAGVAAALTAAAGRAGAEAVRAELNRTGARLPNPPSATPSPATRAG
jgi:hypothetical protein